MENSLAGRARIANIEKEDGDGRWKAQAQLDNCRRLIAALRYSAFANSSP